MRQRGTERERERERERKGVSDTSTHTHLVVHSADKKVREVSTNFHAR